MNSLPRHGRQFVATGPATAVAALFSETVRAFQAGGFETPALDARLLVCAACGISHEEFAARPERRVSPAERRLLSDYRARRMRGEPVSRILGRREFHGLTFELTPDVLDPRPDTETLVEAALNIAGEEPLRILDLGTGSGCVLVSLLHHLPHAAGVGIDVSPGAVRAARANASRNGVDDRAAFFCGSWLDSIAARFDIVVANPPYIRAGHIDGLAAEVAEYDPRGALDGGADGLSAYRAISSGLKSVLRPGGWVLFETGLGQAEEVREILRAAMPGLSATDFRQWRDLAGRERCVGMRAPIERR